MKTTLLDGLQILTATIKGNLRHQDYIRVNEIAKDFTTYVTGEGAEKKLQHFVPRESEQLFEQRVQLFKNITPDIAGVCIKPMYKIGRVPANEAYLWGNDSQSDKKKADLLQIADDFYGKQSVKEYLSYRMAEMDSTDPNSFIVVEFQTETEDGKTGTVVDPANPKTKAIPYPFEVSSKEAIDYFYKNNILQYLTVRVDKSMETNKAAIYNAGEKLTMYLSNYAITAEQYDLSVIEDVIQRTGAVQLDEAAEDFKTLQPYYFKVGKSKGDSRHYIIKISEHKIGFVPANRVGSIHDLTTRNRTCVPLIYQAQPYFEKAIKSVSEFDLTNCLHTFPQKIQYTDACEGSMEGDIRVGCLNGRTPTGATCSTCGGSGKKVHKSAQDMLEFKMPKDLKDMVSLENVLIYKSPPIDLLEYQKKFAMTELRNAASRAVYNSELFQNDSQIASTATEKVMDLDSVYDTLLPFAKNYSEMYRFIIECIASLRDMGDGFKCEYTLPNDYKMVPYSQLLLDYKTANENNAPSYIKKAITRDLSRKLYLDQPEELLKIETKEKFYPFAGKSETETALILSSGLTTRENEILYANFDLIFNELEAEATGSNLNFYSMEQAKQKALIDKKVQDLIAKIDNNGTDNLSVIEGALGSEGSGQDLNTPTDVEAEAKAKLKGSVGGVQGILEIQASVASGITDLEAAVVLLGEIYGFNDVLARKMLGKPKEVIPPVTA